MTDSIIQTKTCQHCQSSFEVTQSDLNFYNKISPNFAGQQFDIPHPRLCPDCRQRRRLSFRNERKLYKRKCDASGKDIISIYAPQEVFLEDSLDSKLKVFDQNIRWSDDRDPMDYGFEFDFSHSFTENFRRLLNQVPRCSIINKNSENSDYTNISAYNKNCYMIIESSNNEDCYHGYRLQKSNNCTDCSMVNDSQLCYESTDLENCYGLQYAHYCRSCTSGYLLDNCTNCSECFGCASIESKQYYIFNKPATKEEYEDVVQQRNTGDNNTKNKILTQFNELKQQQSPYKHIRNSDNIQGDFIYDASNISHSYEINDAKDVAYSTHVWFNSHNVMDSDTVGYNSSYMYESINTALDSTNNIFCIRCWTCSQCLYSDNCDNSSNLFGCVGIRNQQYCIFNRQYENKEKYEEQVSKIIQHMMTTGERGEFFHPSLSPFGYNETVAQEYFPLPNDLVIARRDDAAIQGITNQGEMDRHATLAMTIDYGNFGYSRSTYEAPTPQVDKVIRGEDLPVSITDVDDTILQQAIQCEISNKLFRIIPQELVFYRKHNIPLPRKHPDIRHNERMQLRK